MKMHDRRVLALCFFLSGATSLMLQVAWSKELSYVLGNTLYAVATVVAAFMGGLGLGSGLASRFGSRIRNPIRAYAWMELIIAFCGAASIPLFRSLGTVLRPLYAFAGNSNNLFLLSRFLIVFITMAVPVTLMGMTLPVVIAAVGRRQERYEVGAGYLYGINTLGAVCGTLAVGFWQIPRLGLRGTCFCAGLLDAGIAVAAWWLCRQVGDVEDLRGIALKTPHLKKREPIRKAARSSSEWTGGMLLVAGVY